MSVVRLGPVLLLLACSLGARGAVMDAVRAGRLGAALDEYERLRGEEGADGRLLAFVAERMLEQSAAGDRAYADAAIGQLTLAGTAGQPALERLAFGPSGIAARTRALAVLARRRDARAVAELRGMLGSPDSAVLYAAISALTPASDADELLRLSQHSDRRIRAAVASRMGGAPGTEPTTALWRRLTTMARADPAPRVRAAATGALGSHGARAFAALRERLSDAAPAVRRAAVRALAQADPDRARAVLRPMLELPVGPATIEAARVLATRAPAAGTLTPALAFLAQALSSPNTALRAQAAGAALGWPRSAGAHPALTALLQARVRAEPTARVKLLLALALERAGATAQAREALASLLTTGGMPSVQAAATLAAGGDPSAIAHLTAVMEDGVAPLRRTAARALAREAAQPDAARIALRDDDALVRIYAAGGILAASLH